MSCQNHPLPPAVPPGQHSNFVQNGPPSQESLNALQKAIETMEEKGMQEDPRYSHLLALKARATGVSSNNSAINQVQMLQLR